ncbi:MAG TPA: hypothetical protein VJT49_13270 [Amycolatopsis sp.]|uniref:hypothetical protein n=1 Tax=Amycolatopsis sp. TaxID=37632 RepID=UPI002B482EBC|nr:hypothetical protein [Amycolatopsis sp.]HJQ45734.1 hypothetical protein [Amycolatopsis sp.]HKS46056.1 hypothetical protein [Amycolatopsis sp.]
MSGLVAPLVTLAVFAVPLAGLPWLASRVRRRGVGAGLLGPIEEIWGHPGAHRARFEIEVRQERQAEAPFTG